MNERIRELVEQAIVDVDVVYEDNPLNEELAKMYIPECFAEQFALLIVRECMEVVKWTPSDFPNDEYVKNIKEHFGVES
jgi:zona occludens toxin (predicted ATPase)